MILKGNTGMTLKGSNVHADCGIGKGWRNMQGLRQRHTLALFVCNRYCTQNHRCLKAQRKERWVPPREGSAMSEVNIICEERGGWTTEAFTAAWVTSDTETEEKSNLELLRVLSQVYQGRVSSQLKLASPTHLRPGSHKANFRTRAALPY